MSSEAVFVAIGVACVVAVLLFIVFIIYCVKKQQDKEQDRQMRQRRAREERHRRRLMRTNIVHPPPYDPNRLGMFPIGQTSIPISPPPEYKEVATPVPRNRTADERLNILPFYGYTTESDNTEAISRNVAPVNTALSGDSHFIGQTSITGRSNYYNNNVRMYPNRNTSTITANNGISDNSLQVRPQSTASSETSDSVSRSSNGHPRSNIYQSPRNNTQTNTSRRQQLDAASLLRAQYEESRLTNSIGHGERISANNNNDDLRRYLADRLIDRRQSYNGATQINYIAGSYGDRGYNSTSQELSASYGGSSLARTFGNVLDSNIVQVAPAHTPRSGHQTERSTLYPGADHNGVRGSWILESEDLSLI